MTPCGFIINRRYGITLRLHLQGRRNNASEEKCQTVANRLTLLTCLVVWVMAPASSHEGSLQVAAFEHLWPMYAVSVPCLCCRAGLEGGRILPYEVKHVKGVLME
jgi:hypothetical protein